MKYINADKLKAAAELCRENTGDFIGLIDASPAADVIPVRHGHILENNDGAFTCSVCGDRYIMRANYCPNCAARLDGPVSYVAGTYLDWDNGRYCPKFGKDDRELEEEYEEEKKRIWKKLERT